MRSQTMLKRLLRVARWLLAGFGALALTLIVIMVMRQDVGRPELYEFSPGFRGWFIVQYGKPNCSALPKRGIFRVIRIPPSGHACTSSAPITGWQYTRYAYVGSDGARHQIPSSEVTWGYYVQERKTEVLFLGTEQEMRSNWGGKPQISSPSSVSPPAPQRSDKKMILVRRTSGIAGRTRNAGQR